MTTIVKLNHDKARKYFLQSENYCNVDFPKYVNFQSLLNEVDKKIGSGQLSSWYDAALKPQDDEKVNYRLLGNKDNNYGWRPYELINPALYVDLVHLITEQQNWKELAKRFDDFSTKNLVTCCSMPMVKHAKKTQRGTQILAWWEGVEQESIKLSLSFNYVYDADISNCYSSIYTHSISWALHGKPAARADRSDKKLLGSRIDEKFQTMRYRQTNGIPQGNTLSDFIAELVLAYADEQISEKIRARKPAISARDFKIIRYRDDYRIFINKPELGKLILKYISECLSDLGMHLNTSKTKESSDAVLASVKDDKIDELFVIPREDNYAKWLLQIYATIQRHPNSGKVVRQLNYFHKKLYERYEQKEKLEPYERADVMMGMIANIAVRNPKYYNWSAAIISILLEYTARSKRKITASKIVRKFEAIPNTGLLDIWMQRVTFPEDPTKKYSEIFCQLVTLGLYPGNDLLWSSSWLAEPSLKKIIKKTPIIDKAELRKLAPVMDRVETDNFRTQPT